MSWTTPTPASSWRLRSGMWTRLQHPAGRATPKRSGGLVVPLAGKGAKDDVPQWGGDAKAVAVVLKVVAHVLLAQPLAEV